MTVPNRPLAGLVVNLSVSQSDDTLKHGYPSWQVNRVTLQFVAALFGQGASVIFGHDWREDGVMEAVHGFALQMQPPLPLAIAAAQAEAQPLMRNLLPWPDAPHLSQEEQEQLSATLKVETGGLPEELRALDAEVAAAGPNDPRYAYLRARGLTHLRHRLTDLCHARVCLGGPRSGSQGRYPGLVEEALLAVQQGKPLYVASLLGGVSEQIVTAVEGKQMPDEFCPTAWIEHLYLHPPVVETDPVTRADRAIDRDAIWREFSEAGQGRIAQNNRLSAEQNNELLRTPVVERAIELVLTGLSRIRAA
ncbi:MAG: hypothetical protein U0R19_40015 [Bryobacteraceae bacterium]